jgi:NTE family protein
MAGELAIVLSGGGAKGAFQVGVLDELITNRGVKIDVAVGTSTGSIQALAVAQGDIPKLLQLWLGIRNNSDIYVKKPLGVGGGVVGADSLYDAKGLRKLLKQNADDAKLRSTARSFASASSISAPGSSARSRARRRDPQLGLCQLRDACLLRSAEDQRWRSMGGWRCSRCHAPLDSARTQPQGRDRRPRKREGEANGPRTYDNLIEIGLRSVDILQKEVSRSCECRFDQRPNRRSRSAAESPAGGEHRPGKSDGRAPAA